MLQDPEHDINCTLDSCVLNSQASGNSWSSNKFADIFEQQKLPIQTLFENSQPIKDGLISQDKLFNDSYDTITRNRLSNLISTIKTEEDQEPQTFSWTAAKPPFQSTSNLKKEAYPENIDFLESSEFGDDLSSRNRLNMLELESTSEVKVSGIQIDANNTSIEQDIGCISAIHRGVESFPKSFSSVDANLAEKKSINLSHKGMSELDEKLRNYKCIRVKLQIILIQE